MKKGLIYAGIAIAIYLLIRHFKKKKAGNESEEKENSGGGGGGGGPNDLRTFNIGTVNTGKVKDRARMTATIKNPPSKFRSR